MSAFLMELIAVNKKAYKAVGCFFWQGPYVAAFASSNLGDVSPNVLGPHCTNTGESCENANSSCPIGGVGNNDIKSLFLHLMGILCLTIHCLFTIMFSSVYSGLLTASICSSQKHPLNFDWIKL